MSLYSPVGRRVFDDHGVFDPGLAPVGLGVEAEPAGIEVANRLAQVFSGLLRVTQGGVTAAGQRMRERVDEGGVKERFQHVQCLVGLAVEVERGRPVVAGGR